LVQRAVNELIKGMARKDIDENAVVTKDQKAWFDAEIRSAEKELAKAKQEIKNHSGRLGSYAPGDERGAVFEQRLSEAGGPRRF